MGKVDYMFLYGHTICQKYRVALNMLKYINARISTYLVNGSKICQNIALV